MPKYSKERNDEHSSLVRRILIRKPEISVMETKDAIKRATGLELNKDYVHKMIKEILEERTKRYNNYTKSLAIAKYEDFIKDLDSVLYKIKDDKGSSNGEKIQAVRTLVENQRSIMNMLMDMGILERDLGRIKADVVDVAGLAKILREANEDARFNTKSTE